MNGRETFNGRTMAWVVLASLMAAAAFFLLSTYAPEFRGRGKGGATPLSKSAVGYAGAAKLLELSGRPVRMVRSEAALTDAALLIVALTPETEPKRLRALLALREYKTTLFILPKWVVMPRPDRPGWDMSMGTMPPALIDRLVRTIGDTHVGRDKGARPLSIGGVAFRAPEELQWVRDSSPVVAVGAEKALVAKVADQPHYVLADPDLMNNQGLADRDRSAAMLALIGQLRKNDDPVMFDLTLHGFGGDRNLQKLLVEPPFLALTLSVLFAAALALGQGFVRFGPAQRPGRGIAFGKFALADMTARLLRRAGRLGRLGPHYGALQRQRAGELLGAPAALSGPALDAWLDARGGQAGDSFSALAAALDQTADEAEMQTGAMALHRWIGRNRRDR